MPKGNDPTAGIERDYARYGRRRTGAPSLPNGPAETPLFAQRVLRARLGPILAQAAPGAAGLAISLRYILLVLLPDAFTTGASSARGAAEPLRPQEVFLPLLIGFLVLAPTIVLSVASIAGIAFREAATFMEVMSEEERDSTSRGREDLGRAARVLARSAALFALTPVIGLAILVFGIAAGEGSGSRDEFSIAAILLGGLLVLIGGLASLGGIARALIAVPVALEERRNAKLALARTRDLTKSGPSVIAPARVDSALASGLLLAAMLLGGLVTTVGLLNVREVVAGAFDSSLARVAAGEAIANLPLFVVFLFVTPYICLLASVTYFERRVAVEGLEIELMARRLDEARGERA